MLGFYPNKGQSKNRLILKDFQVTKKSVECLYGTNTERAGSGNFSQARVGRRQGSSGKGLNKKNFQPNSKPKTRLFAQLKYGPDWALGHPAPTLTINNIFSDPTSIKLQESMISPKSQYQ